MTDKNGKREKTLKEIPSNEGSEGIGRRQTVTGWKERGIREQREKMEITTRK